jgi:hypothetical protein
VTIRPTPSSTPAVGTSRLIAARVTGRLHAAEDLDATSRALVAQGKAWATHAKLADALDVSPQRFDDLCKDGDPAIADGDVEALGARFAVPYWRRRIARMEAALGRCSIDLRDLALDVMGRVGQLAARVRLAAADDHYDARELDEIEAITLGAQAELAAVMAACAAARAKLRAGDGR